MSIGKCYLIEALLDFLRMEELSDCPKENSPLPDQDDSTDEEKRGHLMTVCVYAGRLGSQILYWWCIIVMNLGQKN